MSAADVEEEEEEELVEVEEAAEGSVSAASSPMLLAVAMLTDPLLFQEWRASVRRYYGDGHLQPLDVILGDHARALFSMISTLKYPSLATPVPDLRLQWGCLFSRSLHLQRRILSSRVLSLTTARLLINLDLQ